jgi:Flp pilus assembly pilin Flp
MCLLNYKGEHRVKKLQTAKNLVTKQIKNEKGQGMLEYVMLLAVVAALVLVFKGMIKDKITTLTAKVGSSADEVVNP